MGTTLALTGANNLAGALIQHPNDLDTAFAQYEARMRPIVTQAQMVSAIMKTKTTQVTVAGISRMYAAEKRSLH